MPLYEYKCLGCGQIFEKLIRSLSSTVKIECDRCHSEEVEKLISSFATSGTAKDGETSTAGVSCNSCSHRNCSSCG